MQNISFGNSVTPAICVYYLTTGVLLGGVFLGSELLPRQSHPSLVVPGTLNALGNWDGVWYSRIVHSGYSYRPETPSSVAFFPVYPLLAWCVASVSGFSAHISLLIVAHISLAGLFVLAHIYARERFGHSDPDMPDWVLVALGLWPTTMFLRMTYTESTFLLLVLASLWAMQRRWPLGTIALLVGLTTACRATGVALLVPLVYHVYTRRSSRWGWLGRAALWGPVGCWGLVAYITYQYAAFNEPFAFVKTQRHWALQHPESMGQHAIAMLTLEPIWSKYDPESTVYWARLDRGLGPLFSLEFANPIYFVVSAGLVSLGLYKRWINMTEFLLAVTLLAVPYVAHGYRAGMMGQARFASVVFPVYLVLGQGLSRIPAPLAALVAAMMAVGLFCYAAMFASWQRFI